MASRTTLSRPASRRIDLNTLAQRAIASAVLLALAACSTAPVADIRRDANPQALKTQAGTSSADEVVLPARDGVQPLPDTEQGPRPQIRRGTGQVINQQAASAPPPALPTTGGGATFNFEGESLHAVVKAILGDMLGQNYVIAPGVQGTVTLGTPKPVSPAEALNLLEMVLGWNNARLIYTGGRYNVVPADQALASGAVAPRTGAPSLARGYEVRAVPLRYISATEMEKVLKPYARPNAVVSVDNARNIINLAGTRAELENYLRTVEIFDVDWLSGMSVGVFPLTTGKANKVVADLEKVFGESSKSPVAGMFRFMPLDGANAVLVITPQAAYLDDIQEWLERIDGAGGDVQLYSYELKYIKAKDLADRLAEVFGGSRSGGSSSGNGQVSMMPGLESVELRDTGNGSAADIKGGSGDSGSGDSGMSGTGEGMSLGGGNGNAGSGNGTVTLEVNGDRVGVSAVQETNSILVRSSPGAWKSIKDVIAKLDVMPLQVQIEAQVVEVTLSGHLKYGVSWFFENAVDATRVNGGAGLPDATARSFWGDIAGSITNNGIGWTFLGRNAAAIVSALDQVGDLQTLQAPSVLVRNNVEATLNVGARIPISSVTFNPNQGTEGTVSQVQYLDTGTILKVRPRVSRDGMVFMEIVQEISTPGIVPDVNGNVRIDSSKLKTEAAVQSGDTIMLAGLINDSASKDADGVPGLSRIPVIGALFGTQETNTIRKETVILITPTVVRNPQEARDLTDEYGQRFRAMQPLQQKPRDPRKQ
ncbi:type II secretion system secretin GspD [Agrilutibacter solisilvae]|uniref:Type II secretion system secretin GspD n=1 Tax=Agrilutibacter solisilvae TaxID=2763317 RepID=A0A975AT66_9GAMM|nr:type II secretion system secretin GspD [Lysobacter solisilvae]QSX79714.1 type II secretion system secretin GspD [Lysobacter solisilvae]